MPLLLGLDVGTSSVKAVLYDVEARRIAAAAGHEYPLLKPRIDQAEQNPDDWWQAAIVVTRRALDSAGRRDVAAIGFSGQMHGTVLIDAARRPVRPAIIWADQRSADECARLVASIGSDAYTQTAGTLPAAGFMGPTLLWLLRHEPESLRRAQTVIFPKDYVRLQMTGDLATDISDAAGSGILDVGAGRWASHIIEAVGLPENLLPPIAPSAQVMGQLRQEAADALGLDAGIPVVAGCGDQPAQAVANGLIAPGAASITLGSGGQVCIPLRPAADAPLKTDPRCHVFNHALPGMYYILGATLSAGLSLRWLRGVLRDESAELSYADLNREAGEIAPGAEGILFLPYLSGERTPHMDAHARGAFIGLSYHHGRGHLVRAVMEGVALALRQALEVGLTLSSPVTSLIGAGGGLEDALWRQIMADITGLPIHMSALTEHAGTGAAWLAGVGAQVYASADQACAENIEYSVMTEPDMTRHRFYQERYAQFLRMYPLLREELHQLARG